MSTPPVFSAHRNNVDTGQTVISVLEAAHRGGEEGVFPFLSSNNFRAMRGVSTELRDAVARFPIHDVKTLVRGDLASWRKSFPKAKAINISGRGDLTDADFVHLRGLKTVIMDRCTGITDAAFEHLEGIHTLDMSYCRNEGITNNAFVHLKGIHTLNMIFCNQAGITDAAFAHLTGIHTLDMAMCNQAGITDAAFVHLKGIHTLDMSQCNQVGITDAAFAHLKGVHTLYMSYCNQAGITDAAFVHLKGIHTLNITRCTQRGITDSGSLCHLEGATIIGKVLNCPASGGARRKPKTKKRNKFLKRKSQKRR